MSTESRSDGHNEKPRGKKAGLLSRTCRDFQRRWQKRASGSKDEKKWSSDFPFWCGKQPDTEFVKMRRRLRNGEIRCRGKSVTRVVYA